jgi:hypothetical protein
LVNPTPILTLQVLAGIRFIWSRELPNPRVSTENIFISLKGEVKIGKVQGTKDVAELTVRHRDHTLFPDNNEHTSANLESLGTVMLRMMNETRESLDSTAVDWSAEALDFVKETSLVSPDELSDVSSSMAQFCHC